MKPRLTNALGWYGMAAVIAAYGLVSLAGVRSDGFWYLFLNLTGSLGLLIEARYKKDSPVVALNALWLIIALAGIFRAAAS